MEKPQVYVRIIRPLVVGVVFKNIRQEDQIHYSDCLKESKNEKASHFMALLIGNI